jgi:hypothetical protein
LRLCQDCAERCWRQLGDCVGISLQVNGRCTFYSRIDGIASQSGSTVITTLSHIP